MMKKMPKYIRFRGAIYRIAELHPRVLSLGTDAAEVLNEFMKRLSTDGGLMADIKAADQETTLAMILNRIIDAAYKYNELIDENGDVVKPAPQHLP